MRIPLDYYRILGLPIQATVEQLQQAHRDRALQLPRREYSEAAIAARRQLLDEAYAVLSNPEQRQAYDASFLAKSYELEAERLSELSTTDTTTGATPSATSTADSTIDPYTPSIEIEDNQLVGALLILLELGEYELVLKLGRPFLSSGSISLKNGRFGEPDIVLADIVLTLALACLELGREQWQQGQYENAAESLETGQELLLREGLFASVRGEMQADLFKLRPYRILELLALPEENVAERRQGLLLLQDMWQDRGGIDGTGDDQSGLNIDDFLRFIQQLRGYLTAGEQQTLFEAEARRPSAVATYLAVYALLARGFAQRQPALIRRAKLMLMRLGSRQDVHLEQAVCALLLGQTEEASRALELSQEYEPLAFIREHSQGSPDLLPGLCLYGERWLQEEVFPHFRDLARQQASLKEYFADEQVQAYLEELPNEAEPANQWAAVKPPVAHNQVASSSPVMDMRRSRNRPVEQARFNGDLVSATTATIPSTSSRAKPPSVSTMPAAERISQLSPEGRLNAGASSPLFQQQREWSAPERVPLQPPNGSRRSPDMDNWSSRPFGGTTRHSSKAGRLVLAAVALLLGIGILGFLASRVYGWLFSGPTLEGEQLQIQIDQPLVVIPEPDAETSAASGAMTEEVAEQIVQAWYTAKSAALGSEHEVEQLEQILVDPALTQWQRRAEEGRRDGWYWQYQHNLEITSVETNEANPDQARIEAEVNEAAEFYERGQLNLNESYDDNLRVRYNLVRQDNQWRIRDMDVL